MNISVLTSSLIIGDISSVILVLKKTHGSVIKILGHFVIETYVTVKNFLVVVV